MSGINPIPNGPAPISSYGLGSSAEGNKAAGPDFGKALKNYINEVDQDQQTSHEAIQDLLTGKSQDVLPVVTAMAKADLSFKLLMGVRNKVIDAYTDALRLRVQWRSAQDDPALRAQAVEIATELIRGRLAPEDAIAAARAFAATGQRDQVLQLLDFLSRMVRDRRAARAALALLQEVIPAAEAPRWEGLRKRLARAAE